MSEIQNDVLRENEFHTNDGDALQIDYSFYTWYKGEAENPYTFDSFHPLAAPFWEQERQFHQNYLKLHNSCQDIKEAYRCWKNELLHKGLEVVKVNATDIETANWTQAFETGKIIHDSENS